MSDSSELAIRDLAARYIDAVNRFDAEAWAATWSETAVWTMPGVTAEGRDNILQLWQGAMGSFNYALMALNSGTLHIDGDSASGRWYITEHLSPKEGPGMLVFGVYDDRYTCEDGQWLFAERTYNILYRGASDYSGEYTPYPG